MNFIEKITGSDMTKKMKDIDSRVSKLPSEYRSAWKDVQDNFWEYSDFTGRKVVEVLENVLEMLEENASNGVEIEKVFGNDIKGFCKELASVENLSSFQDKWRDQLNKNTLKKLGK